MGQLDAGEEVKVEEPGKERKGRGRPRKAIVPHTLSPAFEDDRYKTYRELYYTDSNEIVGINKIAERIQKADLAINKSIAQTALDIYFVKANWKSYYSKDSTKKFDYWLEKTIPLSRSYVWDLLKCVKDMVAFKSGNEKSKELDDVLLASVQQVFDKFDISLLRDVIHLPKEVKGEYLGKLMDLDTTVDKAVVKATKDRFKTKPGQSLQNSIVDHVFKVDGKEVLQLSALAAEDAGLAIEVEKAIERAYRKYIKNQNKK
jgi:hypothetical protein